MLVKAVEGFFALLHVGGERLHPLSDDVRRSCRELQPRPAGHLRNRMALPLEIRGLSF